MSSETHETRTTRADDGDASRTVAAKSSGGVMDTTRPEARSAVSGTANLRNAQMGAGAGSGSGRGTGGTGIGPGSGAPGKGTGGAGVGGCGSSSLKPAGPGARVRRR
jgi:hypothetical protein